MRFIDDQIDPSLWRSLATQARWGGPPQAIARGRVTLDGQLLAHGSIAFIPADGKGPTVWSRPAATR